eukprot:36802-Eustigmatos_ZCMA.PRE.1
MTAPCDLSYSARPSQGPQTRHPNFHPYSFLCHHAGVLRVWVRLGQVSVVQRGGLWAVGAAAHGDTRTSGGAGIRRRGMGSHRICRR